MKKNILIFGGMIVFVLVGFLILNGGGSGSKNNAPSASVLSALEEKFDFGTIAMKNGKVSHKFPVKNSGTEPLVIGKVYTSCMCTVANIIDAQGKSYGVFGMPGHGGGISTAEIEVGAGETVIVEAIFDPAAHGPSGVGLADRVVYLETNSTQSPKVELSFSATVTN
ncbi:MAG: DUF1573 domain-containing protein [Patescibacteria group bacterium]